MITQSIRNLLVIRKARDNYAIRLFHSCGKTIDVFHAFNGNSVNGGQALKNFFIKANGMADNMRGSAHAAI